MSSSNRVATFWKIRENQGKSGNLDDSGKIRESQGIQPGNLEKLWKTMEIVRFENLSISEN